MHNALLIHIKLSLMYSHTIRQFLAVKLSIFVIGTEYAQPSPLYIVWVWLLLRWGERVNRLFFWGGRVMQRRGPPQSIGAQRRFFVQKARGEDRDGCLLSSPFLPPPFLTVEESLTLRVSSPHNNQQPTVEYTLVSSQQQIASENNQQPLTTSSQQQNTQYHQLTTNGITEQPAANSIIHSNQQPTTNNI